MLTGLLKLLMCVHTLRKIVDREHVLFVINMLIKLFYSYGNLI